MSLLNGGEKKKEIWNYFAVPYFFMSARTHFLPESVLFEVRNTRIFSKVHGHSEHCNSNSRCLGDVHIGENLIDACKLVYAKYQDDKEDTTQGFYDTRLVVCQKNGKPYRPDFRTQKWERFVKYHNLKHIKFHALRPSYTSVMLQA